MKIEPTVINGVVVVSSERRADPRGGFARWFCEDEMMAVLGGSRIVQINHSYTRHAGTVRGMHFQYPPYAEKKLVRCLSGKILDVAVDLRQQSPTFLQWVAVELVAGDDRALLIPEGCAHGFQALTDDVQMLYLHTAMYTPVAEGALRFDDPRIGVEWPLPPQFMSDRDMQHPMLQDNFTGIA
jgi:dTDP-4-dehydrorhamnose 3,5-epimerase